MRVRLGQILLLALVVGCRGSKLATPTKPPAQASTEAFKVAALTPGAIDNFPAGAFPFAEEWDAGCRDLVLSAAVPGRGVTAAWPVGRRDWEVEPLSAWKLPCPGTQPFYELIINESGSVECARILRVTYAKPPDGLYAAVRKSLMKARFKPATLNGKPVTVRMSFLIQFKCA